MKVTVEHNGETIWSRDSESGAGMTSRRYLTDGTQQKIVTALIDALTQAEGEMSLPRPVSEACLTFSDDQINKMVEGLKSYRPSIPVLYADDPVTITDGGEPGSIKLKLSRKQVRELEKMLTNQRLQWLGCP